MFPFVTKWTVKVLLEGDEGSKVRTFTFDFSCISEWKIKKWIKKYVPPPPKKIYTCLRTINILPLWVAINWTFQPLAARIVQWNKNDGSAVHIGENDRCHKYRRNYFNLLTYSNKWVVFVLNMQSTFPSINFSAEFVSCTYIVERWTGVVCPWECYDRLTSSQEMHTRWSM